MDSHFNKFVLRDISREGTVRGLIEVWGSTQDWGHGGTATSIFLPFRLVLDEHGAFVSNRLEPDRSTWPKLEIAGGPISAFLAGLDQRNPDLMRTAVAEWPEPASLADWCSGFGFPQGREALHEMIDAVETVNGARSRLDELTKGFR